MADGWYCEIAGREIGPLSPEQLRAMAAKGQILANDCVRQGSDGTWILARQVKGLLPAAAEASGPKPAVSQVAGPEILPVAERLPEMPAAQPKTSNVFDAEALGIVFDPPAAKAIGMAGSGIGSLRERRRLERQKMMVGVLVATVGGLVIMGLLLALGGNSSESGQDKPGSAAPAQKALKPKAPAETPEALEAREGIDSLDSPPSQPRKIDAETPKTPIAADSSNGKAARSGDSTTAAPKMPSPPKKPREPKPATPEADSGLPRIDGVSE